jgi:membrane protein DedA with SNARE-associated domain
VAEPRSTGSTLSKATAAAVAAGVLLVVAGAAVLAWRDRAAVVSAEREAVACCGVELAALGPYLEESGVPMPVPAEVSIAYLGHRASGAGPAWLAATWAGLSLDVVLGATNLFALSRRFGRRLVSGRIGVSLRLTRPRLARAERWFARWGPLAIAFSRCVPGLRFPMAVACGALGVSYRAFWAGTALSAAVWVAGFLVLGAAVGDRVGSFLAAHPWLGLALPLPAAGALTVYAVRALWAAGQAPGTTRPLS